MDADLARRLADAGIDPGRIVDPALAWRRLVDRSSEEVTLFDRYAIEGAHRGIEPSDLPLADRQRLGAEFFAVRFPGLELIGGPSGAPVVITAYDEEWPHRFESWRQRLGSTLGETALRIEHVGSTAVKGLAAKPIVDIQVSVEGLEDEARYVPAIESTGVPLRSRHSEDRYFRPPADEPRVVQIHVCEAGGEWERRHLLFRDYLRADEATCDAYAVLKTELAAQYPDDRVAYTEGKTDFIREALGRAERWKARRGASGIGCSAKQDDEDRHDPEERRKATEPNDE